MTTSGSTWKSTEDSRVRAESGIERRGAGDSVPRVELLGHRIARSGLEATAVRCSEAVLRKERIHHVSLNAAKLVRARSDTRLLEILRRAEVVNADGQSLVWASRLLGDPLPERVAGIDLMSRLLEISEAEGFRVYFLGARASVLEQALENLRALHPRLTIAGSHHGYFDARESLDICEEINSARTDILFVAMSSPQKEYWVAEHESRLEVPLIMGVGGALDVAAGVVARAPQWAQTAGLEWAFRVLQEPRRMWRRYLSTNVRFLGIVVAALGGRILRRVGAGRLGATTSRH
jgi:N-acetylglucosaminyldiphosphoundecaprenol N-acetyl-beta-D-mannosaminyltransferase